MNIIVKHDGTDISNWLVSYDREHEICTGVGSVELIVPSEIPRTFHPWDVIEIWENSNKKGKFYVSNLEESAREGTIVMQCDDEFKKLTDYFVTETYTIDYLSYSRTWIEKFLDEAEITYTFTVDADDDGVPLSNNTTLGFDSAYSIITTLLQQTGWYIYFDPTGTAIIGNLNKDVNYPDHTISAADFSEFQRELDDDRLRNRAVVWGNTNPTYGEVFVDISVQTPWNYDANDKRAVVISNSSIYNHAQALELAQKLLKEFTKIKDEKFLLVVNDYNMHLGEIVKVNSDQWNGRGLITRLNATASQDGLVYGVTLDQNCPRMFSFYSELPPTVSGFYVYTGHISDGIWRKHTQGSTWYDDSSGLESGAKVDDLFIKNGTFATVLNDGYLYTRTSETGAWNKYSHGSLRDIQGRSYDAVDIRARACSINYSDNIIAGYNFVPSGVVTSGIPASGLSWVLELTGAQSLIKAEQVVISGGVRTGGEFSLFDLESTGEYNIVSASGYVPVSGYNPEAVEYYNNWGSGYRDISMLGRNSDPFYLPPDSDSLSMGWGYGQQTGTTTVAGYQIGYNCSSLICDQTTQIYWYVGTSNTRSESRIIKIDPDAETSSSWSFTTPTEWVGTALDELGLMIRHKSGNDFDVVAIVEVGLTLTMYHYSYTLGDSTLTSLGNSATTTSAYMIGAGICGGQAILGWQNPYTGYVYAKVLNLTSSSFSDKNIFTGMGAGYSGSHATARIMSSGDSVILGCLYAVGTNLTDYDHCPIGPTTDLPTTMELYATGWKITKYGGSSAITATLIDSVDAPTPSGGNGQNNFNWSYTGPLETTVMTRDTIATSTLLNKAYWTMPIGISTTNCSQSNSHRRTAGYSMIIEFPNLSVTHKKWADNTDTVWWTDSDSFVPSDGSDMLRFGGGNLVVTYGDRIGDSGSYAQPGFICYNGITIHGGDTFSEYRYAHAFNTAFGNSSDDSTLYGDEPNLPKDDLTGQIVSGTTHSSTGHKLVMSQVWNLQDYDSWLSLGTLSRTGLTQHYGVEDKYKIIKFSTTVLPDYPKGTILKHTSNYNLGSKITASDSALEQSLGVFQIIKTTKYPTRVDIAHGVPTVIYDIPKDDADPVTEDFWASTVNIEDSFYNHADVKPVYEARTLNLVNPGAFPTASGTFTAEDYERYIGICNREGILASEYDLSTPWVNLVTVASGVVASGLITHFETSNFVPEGTYIFYTVSGVKSFFQKNPEDGFWIDYSAGLPVSPITIIRVDDVI